MVTPGRRPRSHVGSRRALPDRTPCSPGPASTTAGCLVRRVWSSGSPPSGALRRQAAGEPDAVAELDTVDDDRIGIARFRGEGVVIDRAHPEADPLVETDVAGVGGRRGNGHGRVARALGPPRRFVHESAAHSLALLIR